MKASALTPSVHIPILVEPIVESLFEPFLKASQVSYLIDGTFGGGGHTRAFLNRVAQHQKETGKELPIRVLGFDRDPESIQRGKVCFAEELALGKLELYPIRLSEIPSFLNERIQEGCILGILADLGFSSDQVNCPERGLSFQQEGPLDMRLDQTQGKTCLEFLQTVSAKELEFVLSHWGEERFSRRIASALVDARAQSQLPQTTTQLVQLIVKAVPVWARHGKLHVATRTFQALRMAVNEELEELEVLLEEVLPRIQPGGRAALLTFHSLEDRPIKQVFQDKKKWQPLTKKPIQASLEEVAQNPRSRSAKLRVAERIKIE